MGAKLDGFYGDSAVTVPVGAIDRERRAAAGGDRGVAVQGLGGRASRARGCRTSARRCSSTSRRTGFRWCASSSATGSARKLHEEPQIPNYGTPGRGPRLAEGMVLAIEPMVNVGKPAVKVLGDGWTAVTKDGSLSAHFEHTVVVTAAGCRILTTPAAADGRRGRRPPERSSAVGRVPSRPAVSVTVGRVEAMPRAS